jgi:excisionase family DNA binding protein
MILDENALRLLIREEMRNALRESAESSVSATREPAENTDYITVKRAASIASVTESTLREWLRTGRLRRYGHGRVVRVRLSELHHLMEHGPDASASPNESRIRQIVERERQKGG